MKTSNEQRKAQEHLQATEVILRASEATTLALLKLVLALVVTLSLGSTLAVGDDGTTPPSPPIATPSSVEAAE